VSSSGKPSYEGLSVRRTRPDPKAMEAFTNKDDADARKLAAAPVAADPAPVAVHAAFATPSPAARAPGAPDAVESEEALADDDAESDEEESLPANAMALVRAEVPTVTLWKASRKTTAGRDRRSKDELVSIHLRLSKSLNKPLRRLAVELERDVSHCINEAVAQWIVRTETRLKKGER
jgi:hypothetical protein